MINTFRKNCHDEKYMAVIEGLMTFGNRELFVINTENSGLISMNALPLAFKYKENNADTVGNITLPLNAPAPIPEEALGVVSKVIDNMNIVLEQIVPGLTIGIKDLGTIVFKDAKPGKSIQLMSLKNGKAIPFQYESEGIKKIVSILQLLIVVYNNSSITVAIDEMDGGIFEYLLGEILNIISEKGKGQLIFTSHNLRPLETIDKGFIAFTTTNPENRYIRMTNVKGNNNLRDFYYRDIVLGEQSEQVYNPTNNFEIALAFREAGESFGS
jgi:AAA15 family ATPase/GTPase